jgi:hypothetical protein
VSELTPQQLENRYRSWPPPTWYATRRSRRILAVVDAGSIGMIWLGVILYWHLGADTILLWILPVLWGGAAVIHVVGHRMLVAASRGIVGLAERYLDERQARERQKIQAAAHRATTVIILASGVSLSFAMGKGENFIQISSSTVLVIMLAMYATHTILPSLLAAWRLPDPLPDDED